MGISLAAVFAFAMITNPIFAAQGIDMKIVSTSEFSITTKGTPGNTFDNPNDNPNAKKDAYVWAIFTDELRNEDKEFAAWLAATHCNFDDDSEQSPICKIHGHKLWLDVNTLCVTGTAGDDGITASVDGSTVTINGVSGDGEITAWVTTLCSFTGDENDTDLCPVKVFSFVENT